MIRITKHSDGLFTLHTSRKILDKTFTFSRMYDHSETIGSVYDQFEVHAEFELNKREDAYREGKAL